MTTFKPHEYQRRAIDYGLTHDRCGLFLPMGAGKTVITLSILSSRLLVDVDRVLIIAPVRVATTTWPDEIEKWNHTRELRYSVIAGTPKQRQRALEADADVYLIGKENTKWLVDTCKPWKFNMVVIDELSTFKNPQSQRFKALRKKLSCFSYFIGLTGTPAPRGIPDLWSQIYLIDQGERLGRTLGAFRETFLFAERSNGYTVYNWGVLPGAQKEIERRLTSCCFSLAQSDCVELPGISFIDVAVDIGRGNLKKYREFKKSLVLRLDSGEIAAANAGTLTGQLLQYASGEIYTKDDLGQATGTEALHRAKIEALEDLLDGAGEPVLIFYWYKHEKARIEGLLKKRGLLYSSLEESDDTKKWNERSLDCLLLHPASAGHGLNLQKGGSVIIWYSLPNFNLELYQQANARLYRQGQTEPVRVYRVIAKGTIDEDQLKALERKKVTQSEILEALRKEEVET